MHFLKLHPYVIAITTPAHAQIVTVDGYARLYTKENREGSYARIEDLDECLKIEYPVRHNANSIWTATRPGIYPPVAVLCRLYSGDNCQGPTFLAYVATTDSLDRTDVGSVWCEWGRLEIIHPE
ncbi:hypothetical protein GGI43DRAFT_253915 [Trichoderma evansii]